MSIQLDEQYLLRISSRLPKFKRKSAVLFNARCVICGDSKNDPNKARWYAGRGDKGYLVSCHNCGYGETFSTFLKAIDHTLWHDYIVDTFKEQGKQLSPLLMEAKQATLSVVDPTCELPTIKDLPDSHPAKCYLQSRMIPLDKYEIIKHVDHFYAWMNTVVPNKFSDKLLQYDHPRIIFPIYNVSGALVGIQGRSYTEFDHGDRIAAKYITVQIDESDEKLFFGAERLNLDLPRIFVVEGPIDSLFLQNSIATCGGDIISHLKNCSLPREKLVVVYDNEPRKKETVLKLHKALDVYSYVIWPPRIEAKDINEMVMLGFDVQKAVNNNLYQPHDLTGKLEFQRWKKI